MTRFKAFTLVELLVVVAIIALLLAILLPSLQKAKLVAQTTVCGANMRQIGMAMEYYGQDNDQWLVFHYSDEPFGSAIWWSEELVKYLFSDLKPINSPADRFTDAAGEGYLGNASIYYSAGADDYRQYMRPRGVFGCPSSQRGMDPVFQTDYTKNQFTNFSNTPATGNNVHHWPHRKLPEFRSPSMIYQLAYGPLNFDGESAAGLYSYMPGYAADRPSCVSGRHSGKTNKDPDGSLNMLFLDWHVETMDKSTIDFLDVGSTNSPPWSRPY